MSTSAPPTWHWRDECYVPVETQELPVSATLSKQNGREPLSADSRNLSGADHSREQNDSPDPTGTDIWPLERADNTTASSTVCADWCPECRCAPGQPHAPGCDVSCSPVISCDRKDDATGCDEAAKVTESVSNSEAGAPDECPDPIYQGCHPSWVCNDCGQDRYGKPNGVSTWHYDYCRFCGEFVPCTDPRDFGNRLGDRHDGGQFPGQKAGSEEETHQREQGKDADSFVVASCPECDSVTDIDYGTVKDKPPDCQAYEPEPARSAISAGPLFGDGVHFAHEAPTNLPVGARNEHVLDDNPLLYHMECTFDSCMDIAVAKNEGYAGSADPMANFNDSVRLGVPVPIGVAIRLSDKWARLCRLLQTGKNPLSDESITDTIMDAVNYLAILLYALDGDT